MSHCLAFGFGRDSGPAELPGAPSTSPPFGRRGVGASSCQGGTRMGSKGGWVSAVQIVRRAGMAAVGVLTAVTVGAVVSAPPAAAAPRTPPFGPFIDPHARRTVVWSRSSRAASSRAARTRTLTALVPSVALAADIGAVARVWPDFVSAAPVAAGADRRPHRRSRNPTARQCPRTRPRQSWRASEIQTSTAGAVFATMVAVVSGVVTTRRRPVQHRFATTDGRRKGHWCGRQIGRSRRWGWQDSCPEIDQLRAASRPV